VPYTHQSERPSIDEQVEGLVEEADSFGKLNYTITKIVLGYARRYYANHKYSATVVVMGTLACVGLEFYRRFAVPHEEEKMKENGDVY